MYYGTSTFLLTTLNEDGTTNISPMSSSWALGNYIVLGVGLGGKAIENLERHKRMCHKLAPPGIMGKR